MGQYYTPIIIPTGNKNPKVFYSHDYDNGLKLMEHSYLDNSFVSTVLQNIAPGERLIWLGDYGEYDDLIGTNPDMKAVFTEDKFEEIKELQGDKGDQYKVAPPATRKEKQYVLNITKGEYIDLKEYREIIEDQYGDSDWIAHPIPLLCSVGNGAGGGDYYGPDKEACGRWAGDVIMYTDNLPSGIPFTNISGWYLFKD